MSVYRKASSAPSIDKRLKWLRGFFIGFMIVIVMRLFMLQVVNASFYEALAAGQHSFYQELVAERGDIFVKDWADEEYHTAATNEPLGFVYADPRKIEDAWETSVAVSELLGYAIPSQEVFFAPEVDAQAVASVIEAVEDVSTTIYDGLLPEEPEVTEEAEGELAEEPVTLQAVEEDPYEDFGKLYARLIKEDDPYEPIERYVDRDILDALDERDLDGIYYVLENARSYPEQGLGGHIFGFVGIDQDGNPLGQYGLEGYYQEFLAGQDGYLDSQTDTAGRWIGVGAREFQPAVDGGNVYLTIDRTMQYIVCQKLAEGVEYYDADGGSVVILEPGTGRVLSMCNVPDFDPNDYNEVEDVSVYNNTSIFEPYEPGSVFKPLVMAAAINEGVITPTTGYEDTGAVEVDDYTIRNSDLKSYGWQTMTQVLEKSLNTGMIYVMRLLGEDQLKRYIEDFGFGVLTGIDLATEVAGTIASLEEEAEVYFATASYGQGITVTPLQMAASYNVLASGGEYYQPYVVERIEYPDGTVEDIRPNRISQVVSAQTATTVSAMMVSVVENGYGSKAAVDGYYLAGKTGTAQVARTDGRGYQEGVTIATFGGFGPVEDPRFTMIVKLDHPKKIPWAADTAAPVFGDIAHFLVDYLQIAPR